MTNESQYQEKAAPSSEEMQRIAGYRKNNHWGDLKKHLTYQLQETIEQVTAFNERNEEDFRDASGDIRVLLDAQKASVTYSLDADYNEIVTKLFTRLDDTIEGAERTQQKYADLGVKTYIVHDERTGQYINRVSETVDGTDGEHYPKDKWLKSYKFQTPEFELVGLKDVSGQEDVKINLVKNAGVVMFIGTEDELIEYAQEVALKKRNVVTLELPEGIGADQAKEALVSMGKLLKSIVEVKARTDHHLETVKVKTVDEPAVIDGATSSSVRNPQAVLNDFKVVGHKCYSGKVAIPAKGEVTFNAMGEVTLAGIQQDMTDYLMSVGGRIIEPHVMAKEAFDLVINNQTAGVTLSSNVDEEITVLVEINTGSLNHKG